MSGISGEVVAGRAAMRGARGAPRLFAGSASEALAEAARTDEPLWMESPRYEDARGWSMMNLLRGVLSPAGQVNVSVQRPGVVKAWHRHAKQTDFWVCPSGTLLAGVWRERDGATWSIVLGGQRGGVLVIPSGLWHGAATLGEECATLVYYVTHAYDPANPDEQRLPEDACAGFDWTRG